LKILILGGYGVFGGRLIELLSDIGEAEILVAGRSGDKAAAFCRTGSGEAALTPLQLDRAGIAAALETHRPDIVVDASGPFQMYGDDPYRVVSACIEAGVHYLDFADAADFVFGIPQFDAAAKEAGVAVLSGVSSFPVLTAAVLREMEKEMTVESLTGGIAPSPDAGIGLNVMRAVVSYAGGPVKLTRGGKPTVAKGLTESLRYTIAVPGRLPLRNIRFSLVDVPDLQVLPAEQPSIKDIWMGAGPIPEILHRILNGLAIARAQLNLPSFEALSPLFYRVLNLMKFGEHRGGMFVEATGTKDGQPFVKSWHLLAEGDDGPYIPSMAIEALIRKWCSGDRPAPGARPATGAVDLEDYDRLFEGRTIFTGMRDQPAASDPPYKRVLGSAFFQMPPQLQDLHGQTVTHTWSGDAEVLGGRNPVARLIARIAGFPNKTGPTPVTVTFTPEAGGEHWERDFGGSIFRSYQTVGKGRNTGLLTERFGAVTVALALVLEAGTLRLVPRRWTVFGLPLPNVLLPNGDSFEYEEDGAFHFDVTIRAPMVGLIAAYKGRLKREAPQAPRDQDFAATR
jgi:saccharopine dehydrogenase-like NADP-dependent oxidoreductase